MKKLRLALIGHGFIGAKGHFPAYLQRDDVEICAICDISEGRRKAALMDIQKHFSEKDVKIYEDYRTLLEKESHNLDVIDICTPAATHAQIALDALEAGLHVLCEKPLTTNLDDAEKLVEMASSKKKVVFPCHNYKHAPVVQAIQSVIKSGKIGQVRSITLNTFRNTHAKGVTEWNTHWRRHKKHSGGGIAMVHGSHSLYLTFDWLGSYPQSITASMTNFEPQKYDTEDNFNATLSFPTGLATLHLTWTAGVRKVIYTIQGSKGAITVDDDDMQIAIMKQIQGEDVSYSNVTWEFEKVNIASHWMDSSHVSWFNSMFDQFKDCIETDQYVNKDLLEAYLCVQAITKAYESAEDQGRMKNLPVEILNTYGKQV